MKNCKKMTQKRCVTQKRNFEFSKNTQNLVDTKKKSIIYSIGNKKLDGSFLKNDDMTNFCF